MILKPGMLVKYTDGGYDGQLPQNMVGEVRSVESNAQGTHRCRVTTSTGGSALIEEFRLEQIQIILG